MFITFVNRDELANALREAQTAHHEYEEKHGKDHDWAAWYANHIDNRQMYGPRESSPAANIVASERQDALAGHKPSPWPFIADTPEAEVDSAKELVIGD